MGKSMLQVRAEHGGTTDWRGADLGPSVSLDKPSQPGYEGESGRSDSETGAIIVL